MVPSGSEAVLASYSVYGICTVAAGVAGNVFAFVLFLSPLQTIKRIYRNKSTEQFSVLPYVYSLMNCLICMWYGLPFVSYGVTLVVTVNSIGAAFQLAYVSLFIIYADTKRKLKMAGLLIGVVCVFGLIMCISLELFDHQTRQTFVGYLSVASLISMFASPLFIMNLVIKTRSVEFMPFNLSLATFIMSVSFFAYGMLLHDFFIYAGEKRKEEEMIELEGSLGKSDVVNSELIPLERELSSLHRVGTLDSFGLYLYGIILRDKGCESLARAMLVESVNSYPWNWSAWSELQSLCTSTDILNNLNLKNHWMKDFFIASAYQELKMHEEAIKRYESLWGVFRHSDYIQAQIATAQYSLREFDEAEVLFEELLRSDPYRVDSMDIYSNLLYAKESFSALSFLAHRVFLTDKFRPEACCIIANYYSLKGQHEKSVLYFRRALKLNRKYLSAWTLMGHEFVEMKNTPAAIDAYRRAVDINPRDYRAWYGLGQTYEMMGMPFYALYYFRKSSFLQPNDPRLWIAMAQCYESAPLQMLEEAIRCYTKAANTNDREGIALHQLAKLHSTIGHSDQAAFFYKKDLERMEAEDRQGPNMVEALLYLARYYKTEKRFEEAEFYCTRLLDYTGPEKETAKSLLRGLKAAQSGFPSMDVEHFTP